MKTKLNTLEQQLVFKGVTYTQRKFNLNWTSERLEHHISRNTFLEGF